MIILTYMLQACILAHQPYEASTVVPLIDCLMRTHTKLASISKVYRSNMIFEFSQQNVENRTEEDLRTFDLSKFFCKTSPIFHLKEVFFVAKVFICDFWWQSFWLEMLQTRPCVGTMPGWVGSWRLAWGDYIALSLYLYLYLYLYLCCSYLHSLVLLKCFHWKVQTIWLTKQIISQFPWRLPSKPWACEM